MAKIGEIIGKVYYWFWHDLLMRREPFTYSMRRFLNNGGAWAWILGCGLGGSALAWLLLHLGGFA